MVDGAPWERSEEPAPRRWLRPRAGVLIALMGTRAAAVFGWATKNPGAAAAIAVVLAAYGALVAKYPGRGGLKTLTAAACLTAVIVLSATARVLDTGSRFTGPSPTYHCGSVLTAAGRRSQWLHFSRRLFLHCSQAVNSYRLGGALAVALGALAVVLGATVQRRRHRRHLAGMGGAGIAP